MANAMTLVANIYRDSKKKTSPYEMKDFLFQFDAPAEKDDPKKVAEKVKSIFSAMAKRGK